MKLVTDIGPLYIQFSAVVSPDRKYYYTVLNTVEKRDFATNRVLKLPPTWTRATTRSRSVPTGRRCTWAAVATRS